MQTGEVMRHVMSVLEDVFKGYGIALLIFEFEKPGLTSYASNARREDMIEALREAADRLERGQDFPTEGAN